MPWTKKRSSLWFPRLYSGDRNVSRLQVNVVLLGELEKLCVMVFKSGDLLTKLLVLLLELGNRFRLQILRRFQVLHLRVLLLATAEIVDMSEMTLSANTHHARGKDRCMAVLQFSCIIFDQRFGNNESTESKPVKQETSHIVTLPLTVSVLWL